MPKIQLPITGGFYVNRSLPISAQECSNFYVHINQGGGLAAESLFGTPGSNQLATSGTDQQVNRGAHVMNGIPYFVNGNGLYRLTRTISGTGVESFALDLISTVVVAGTGRVSMADNGTQLIIVVPTTTTPSDGYIWVEDTTIFTKITDTDFTGKKVQQVVYVDGFFVITTASKEFFISALNDGLSYNALDVGTAEADPDDIIAPIVQNNILYIGGGQTFEPFRNVGVPAAGTFPFVRIAGGVLSIGVFSPFSLINVSETFFFIGGGENEAPSVYIFTGSGFSIVSNDGIDSLLGQLTDTQLENVFSWSYSEEGAKFVGWTLPTFTIVYDLTSKKWHQRKSFDIIDDVSGQFRWRANDVVKAYGRILISDNQDGRVGEINLDILDEYDQDIISVVSTIPFSNNGDSIKVPSIELTVESGVGNTAVPDPMVSLERSKDGKTLTDKRLRRIGKKGQFKNRAIWNKNGRAARLEVFRFTMTGRVKKVIIKLEANVK